MSEKITKDFRKVLIVGAVSLGGTVAGLFGGNQLENSNNDRAKENNTRIERNIKFVSRRVDTAQERPTVKLSQLSPMQMQDFGLVNPGEDYSNGHFDGTDAAFVADKIDGEVKLPALRPMEAESKKQKASASDKDYLSIGMAAAVGAGTFGLLTVFMMDGAVADRRHRERMSELHMQHPS